MSDRTRSNSTELTGDESTAAVPSRSIASIGDSESIACPHPVDALETVSTNGLTTYVRCERCEDVFVVWLS